jgi:serine/threonine protein kinase
MLAPDTILQNRYRIIRQLGKGGMGAVYEALDQRLDLTVALKETFSTEDRLRRQFEQEARLLAQLHHPALPRVSDHFVEGDCAFLVMQFIAGVDLAAIIAQQPGPFPRNQVVAWADQLLDALIYLHSRDRQIIHRDIKPHNLKITSTGRIALLDFGLAKSERVGETGVSSSDSIFGFTRCYAPLEQIQDEGTTPQSDIYALGATLYHLLTGIKPSDALKRAAALVNGKPDPLKLANVLNIGVGPELAAVLERAMAQNPDSRYRSAEEFREALRHVGRTDVVEPARAELRKEVALPKDEGTTVVHGPTILPPAKTNWGGLAAFAAAVVIVAAVISYRYDLGKDLLASGPATAQISVSDSSKTLETSKATNGEKPRARANAPVTLPTRLNSHPLKQQEIAQTQKPRVENSRTSKVVQKPIAVAQKSVAREHRDEPARAKKTLRPPTFTPQVPDYSSVPVMQRVSNIIPGSSPEPRVSRSADGIRVVKYPDGSTRVFRPGEKVSVP